MKEIIKNIVDNFKDVLENKESYDKLNKNELGLNNNMNINNIKNFVFNDEGKLIELNEKKFLDLDVTKNKENNEIDIKTDKNNINNISDDIKIAFIDGGMCEIINLDNFGVFFYRIYYTIYCNNKRIKNKFFEFYIYIYPIFENKEINKEHNKKFSYCCKIYYLNKKNIESFNKEINKDMNNSFNEEKIINLKNKYIFDAFDKKISFNNKYADLNLIANIIRRFAELNVINNIDSNYVVLDGSFDINYPYEEEIIKDIIDLNLNKKIEYNNKKNIFALSKTNRYFTKKGIPLNYYLYKVAKKLNKKEFFYYLDKTDFFEIYFVLLNEKSDYVFRLDYLKNNNSEKIYYENEKIINQNNQEIKNLFLLLRNNSKDPIFLGYPYGLIEADMFARISNKEKEQLTIKFYSEFKELGKELKKIFSINKTHNILDKIRF